jgi:hypothetical protein
MKTLLVAVGAALVFVRLNALSFDETKSLMQNSSANSNSMKVVPSAEAAKRALCLASILARTNLEYGIMADHQNGALHSSDDNDLFQKKQRHFMEDQGIWNALSAQERTLLEKRIGTWSTQEIANGQWRAEGLGVLLWALGAIQPLPPYDKPMSDGDFLNAFLPDPHRSLEFVEKAALRDGREIVRTRGVAELWLWRARTTQLQLTGTAPPKGWTFDKIIGLAVEKASGDGFFVPINGDFPAHGKAYRKLSQDEWEEMRSIAQERLYALNWLCGYATNWDQVPTGT